MSMAHGLEVRPIFLDHEIVDFVLSLPVSLRIQYKKLLLAAVSECMPARLRADLLARQERTFTLPFAHWFTKGLRNTIDEALRHSRLAQANLLNPVAVGKLWRRYLERPEDVGWSRIWSLFVLTRWCEIMQISV